MTDQEIDGFVGAAIARQRISLGLSQTDLARALDISFQQVQKYEKATNRISASKLWRCAKALGVPVSFFFPPIP